MCAGLCVPETATRMKQTGLNERVCYEADSMIGVGLSVNTRRSARYIYPTPIDLGRHWELRHKHQLRRHDNMTWSMSNHNSQLMKDWKHSSPSTISADIAHHVRGRT